MDNRFEIGQNFYWKGNTMVTDIIGRIYMGMAKEREEEVLRHFEIDFTELQGFLDAKANDLEMVPVVRCRDCKHSRKHEIFLQSRRCKIEDYKFSHKADHFCSYGERKDK